MEKLILAISLLFLIGCTATEHDDAPAGHPVGPQKKTADYKPRMGDRFFVRNVFLRAFHSGGAVPADDTAVNNIINDNILNSSQFFGGPCKFYDDASCTIVVDRSGDHKAAVLSSSSTPREGLRVRACKQFTQWDTIVTTAMSKASLTTSSDFNQVNFKALYNRFYPAKTPSSSLYAAMNTLYSDSLGTYDQANAWRLVLYAVCISPGWQTP